MGRAACRCSILLTVLLVYPVGAAVAQVKVDETTWNSHAALRLSNGTVELIVTTGIGPRIIRYAFVNGDNILGEVPASVTKTELGEWRAYGGHRLWSAPEAKPRTYAPDNDPVEVSVEGGTVRLRQPTDASGLQKELVVTLAATGTDVNVEHAIVNRTLWSLPLAPWALTIMNGGGSVIIPNEPYVSHSDELLPARALSVWGYTDLADARWTFGSRFIRLRTEPSMATPQKIGVANRRGWAAYIREGQLFVKRYAWRDGATYPDFGVNTETFTSGTFIELETLGPLEALAPGATARHEERWTLHRVQVARDAPEAALESALATAGIVTTR